LTSRYFISRIVLKAVASNSGRKVQDCHAQNNWIVDGDNCDYCGNTDHSTPRPVEMDLRNRSYRDGGDGHRTRSEQITLCIQPLPGLPASAH
jgi:hypothetical protein